MATHFTYFYLNLKCLKSWKWAHTSFLHLSDSRNFGTNFHRNVVFSSRDHAIQTLDRITITSNSMIIMWWFIDFSSIYYHIKAIFIYLEAMYQSHNDLNIIMKYFNVYIPKYSNRFPGAIKTMSSFYCKHFS